jgi:hypothetical protein
MMRVIVLERRRRVAGVAGFVEGFADDDLRMGFPLSSAWEAQDSIVSLGGICTFAVQAWSREMIHGPGLSTGKKIVSRADLKTHTSMIRLCFAFVVCALGTSAFTQPPFTNCRTALSTQTLQQYSGAVTFELLQFLKVF